MTVHDHVAGRARPAGTRRHQSRECRPGCRSPGAPPARLGPSDVRGESPRCGARLIRRPIRPARRPPGAAGAGPFITGHREFWGLDFEVTREVLIPRPETELIIEEAIALVDTQAISTPPSIVDAGTGSGCLAIALAVEVPSARITATDLSRALSGSHSGTPLDTAWPTVLPGWKPVFSRTSTWSPI